MRARTNAIYLTGLATGLLLAAILGRLRPEPTEPDIEHYREVREFVRSSFVREVTDQELLDAALHGMLAGLDRYSRYYDAAERDALDRETSGRYEGIGVVFRRPIEEGQVLFALPDSPAARAGVQVGDRFLRLGGEPLAGLDEEGFRTRLGDPPGGVLEVELVRLDGSEHALRIEPTELVDPTVRHARIADADAHIGYISILSFSNETAREFEEAFRFLLTRDMRALVLDLRRNYGGALVPAETIAKRFIDEGPIVRTEGRGEPKVTWANEQDARWLGFPLAVLVDQDSASASEVLAGALQDHRRAVLVGAPTFGKGLVQTIRRFDDQHAVAKVTSSYYYSPSGRNFDRSVDETRDFGILPDVRIELSRDEILRIHSFLARYGPPTESLPAIEAWQEREGTPLIDTHPEDPQLDAALELLRGRRPGPTPIDSHG